MTRQISRRTNLLSEWITIDRRAAFFVGQPVKGHAIGHGRAIAIADPHWDLLKLWNRHVLGVQSPAERLRRLAMVWVWRNSSTCVCAVPNLARVTRSREAR